MFWAFLKDIEFRIEFILVNGSLSLEFSMKKTNEIFRKLYKILVFLEGFWVELV